MILMNNLKVFYAGRAGTYHKKFVLHKEATRLSIVKASGRASFEIYLLDLTLNAN